MQLSKPTVLTTFGTAVLLLVVLSAGPAAAKGPVAVTITGPGLDEPVKISYVDRDGQIAPSPAKQRLIGPLVDGAGMWHQLAPTPEWSPPRSRPKGALGTKYRIAW